MTFAFALTAVVLFSSILLLYQYWTGSLAGEAPESDAPRDVTPRTLDEFPRRPQPMHPVDHAA